MNIFNKIMFLTIISVSFMASSNSYAAAAAALGSDERGFFSKRMIASLVEVVEDSYKGVDKSSSRIKVNLPWVDTGGKSSKKGKLVITKGSGYTVFAFGGESEVETDDIEDGSAMLNFGSLEYFTEDIASDEITEWATEECVLGQCASGYADILVEMQDEINKHIFKSGKFIFAGHGMGGAVAELAALHAAIKRKSSLGHMGVITFGAPPVFNSEAAEAFNVMFPGSRFKRFEMREDTVPDWKADSDLVQVGYPTVAGKGYKSSRLAHAMESYAYEIVG